MYKRINITLPEETLKKIEEFVKSGNRSGFIDAAIHHYIEHQQKEKLKEQLKLGAIANAERDRNLAQEWFALEEEAVNERT